MENVSETFFCVERALFDQMNQLSAHFSVVVQGSSKSLYNCHVCKLPKLILIIIRILPSIHEGGD